MSGKAWVRLALGAALVAALTLVGCGTGAPSRAEVLKALETSGIPPAEAQCAVKAIYDNLTTNQVADLYDRGFGGVPKDNPTDNGDAATRLATAMGACRDAAARPTTAGEPGGEATTTTLADGDEGSAATDGSSTSGPALVPGSGSDGGSPTTKIPTGSNGLNDDPIPSTTQGATTDGG